MKLISIKRLKRKLYNIQHEVMRNVQAIKEVGHLICKNMSSSSSEDRVRRIERLTPEDIKQTAKWMGKNLDTVVVFSQNLVSVNI